MHISDENKSISSNTKFTRLYGMKAKDLAIQKGVSLRHLFYLINHNKIAPTEIGLYVDKRWNKRIARLYSNAKTRCECPSVNKYKYYGGKGIKFKLSPTDIVNIWDRDKADSMVRPSLDRINNNGDYEYKNCRIIEVSANVRRDYHDNYCPNCGFSLYK